MILDRQTTFCWGFTPGSGTTKFSTDATISNAVEVGGFQGLGYIDLGPTDAFALNTNQGTELFGVGGGFSNDLYLEALVYTTMNDTSGTPVATCVVTLETADNAAFNSNLATILTLGTFAAGAKAGTRLAMQLPPVANFRRFLRVKFTIAGAALSAGAFSAFFTTVLNANKYGYPQRSSIQ